MYQAFEPLCGENPRVLILGTFPSPQSRGAGEYYGNPNNQFWRIVFQSLGVPFEAPSYAEKAALLYGNNIALWDVLTACNVSGALDSNIRDPIYNTAIPSFVSGRGIRTVLFNGGNAYTFYRRGIGETERRVLPSTSPANARMSFEQKLAAWRAALAEAINIDE